MDSNDKRIACAAAYYILLCGEFLKSRGAPIRSKNGLPLSQQKQACVTTPAPRNVGNKITPAPRQRDVQARQRLNSAPMTPDVDGEEIINSAPRLGNVEETVQLPSKSLKRCVENVNSAPRLRGVEAIPKESSAPHVVAGPKIDSTSVSAPSNVKGEEEKVDSAPIKSEAPKRARRSSAATAASSKIRKAKRPRRMWMRNKNRERRSIGDFLSDLKKEPSDKLEYFCRMSASDFENILNEIAPLITKKDTVMRSSIPVQERLAVALRFLATGDSFKNLSDLFNFSVATVSICVNDVCKAIIETYHKEVELPTTTDHWQNIAEQYEKQWSFPNCLGAIGGKQIIFQSPSDNSDHTVVIFLALVDANCSFTFVDIGCQKLEIDGAAQINLSFITKFPADQVNLPLDSPLPSSHIPVPYVFLGDEAFKLSQRTMTPYLGDFEKGSAQRIFNYRLARARRVIENVFGLMTSVFGVLRKQKLQLGPEKVINIMKTCVLLHNILMKNTSSSYAPLGTFDTEVDGVILRGSWRNDYTETWSLSVDKNAISNPGEKAKVIRNSFAEYFTTSGRLPWQDECS